MLTYTPEQSAYVLGQRRHFNLNAAAISTTYGLQNSTAMVGNALPVPRDVWGEWDRQAVQIHRSKLAVFDDLAASVAKPMNLGKLVTFFQTISDSGSANVSLDGRNQTRKDKPTFDYHGTALPIIDDGYGFGWREMMAGGSEGYDLPSGGRINSNRKVAEKLEDIALNGDASIKIGDAGMFGLRNHPKRRTRQTGVTLNGATGAQWLEQVNATTGLLYAANVYDAPTLYVNITDWKYARETDYAAAKGSNTIAERILQSGIENVVPSSSVPANEILAVVKRRDMIEVLNGMPISNIPLMRHNPTDDYNFIAMAAASIQIKFDAEDQCGVAHSAP